MALSDLAVEQLQQELNQDLLQLQAEAMGWLPLRTEAGDQGYLHLGDVLALVRPDQEIIIEVVGLPDASLVGMNVVLLG